MPRLILDLGPGAQAASVQASVQALPFVADARPSRTAGVVIVDVPELTTDIREQLANQPGVSGVFDDIQAVPQVAEPEEVEDFLQRVRTARGEDDTPPLLETDPLVRTDGGATTVPPAGLTPDPGPQRGPIANVDDSLQFTGAEQAHVDGFRGDGAIAVIVDTGASPETIRDDRQLEGADLTGEGDPWSLISPHGGMTMGIMAGDETTPGIDVGYAPETDVFPIKTTLAASEIIQAQDIIVTLAQETNRPIVVNNSWGFVQCTGLCGHPVTTAVDNAAKEARVHQVFAAGNQGGEAISACGAACDGSTVGISGPNSLDSVITVGATGLDGEPTRLQPYSSRGGTGTVTCGSRKPDLTAPIFGTVPWGSTSRNIGNGGGTSAACPQVAGTLALIAAENPTLGAAAAANTFTLTARQFMGEGHNGCSGFGNLSAFDAVSEPPPTLAAGIPQSSIVAAAGLSVGVLGAIARRRLN